MIREKCLAMLLAQVTTPTQQQAAAITKSGNGGRGGSGNAAPEESNAVAEVGAPGHVTPAHAMLQGVPVQACRM